LPQVEEAVRRDYPDALDEMRGIADGADLKYEDVLLMNFTSEFGRRAQSGCTAFAAARRATEKGKTIMGKTRDMRYQAYFPFQIALNVQVPGKAHVFLAEAFVGRVVTGCGINEYGLGLMLNVVNIKDFDDSVGIQRSLLARLILEECKDVSEAVERFSKHILAYCGGSFLICDALGNCAVIEKSHAHQAVREPIEGIITATNHFVNPAMTKHMGWSSQSSPKRFDLISALIKPTVGKINVKLAKSFLRNHAHGLSRDSICRHDVNSVNTVSAYVADVTSKRVYIADGHPCKSRFQSYRLKN
jgi:isopenicillin-N N-acyltransferase-like protein